MVRVGRRAALAASVLALAVAAWRLRRARTLLVGGARLAVAAAAGLVAAIACATIVSVAGQQLAWYSRPALLVPLYAMPALGAAGLVSLLAWRAPGTRPTTTASLAADTMLATWATLLLVATLAGVRSGFLASLWTLPPAVALLAADRLGTYSAPR